MRNSHGFFTVQVLHKMCSSVQFQFQTHLWSGSETERNLPLLDAFLGSSTPNVHAFETGYRAPPDGPGAPPDTLAGGKAARYQEPYPRSRSFGPRPSALWPGPSVLIVPILRNDHWHISAGHMCICKQTLQ